MEVSVTTIDSSLIAGFASESDGNLHSANEPANLFHPAIDETIPIRNVPVFTRFTIRDAEIPRQLSLDSVHFHLERVYVILRPDGYFQATLFRIERVVDPGYSFGDHACAELRLARHWQMFACQRLVNELTREEAVFAYHLESLQLTLKVYPLLYLIATYDSRHLKKILTKALQAPENPFATTANMVIG